MPALSDDSARNVFHSLCNLGRSPAVDDLITRLDFHPLSIDLLTSFVLENDWDESALLKAWDNGQAGLYEESHYQTLKDAPEPMFRFPAIQRLELTARNALVAITTFPAVSKSAG